jgi:hypothetical protein
MTKEQFDIHEPYRCYAYMILLFDCHDCKRYLDLDPPYGDHSDWQWFHDAADQAWRAGWYVPPNLPDGSTDLYCLCPDCAAKRGLTAPAAREMKVLIPHLSRSNFDLPKPVRCI